MKFHFLSLAASQVSTSAYFGNQQFRRGWEQIETLYCYRNFNNEIIV